VDWISVGALTHSAPSLDVAMRVEPAGEAGREPIGNREHY
jgi:hypothetical protein